MSCRFPGIVAHDIDPAVPPKERVGRHTDVDTRRELHQIVLLGIATEDCTVKIPILASEADTWSPPRKHQSAVG